jgi:hypothetical protein
MAVGGVWGELVSSSVSLISRESTGKFSEIGSIWQEQCQDSHAFTIGCGPIFCGQEKGINSRKQGVRFDKQGNRARPNPMRWSRFIRSLASRTAASRLSCGPPTARQIFGLTEGLDRPTLGTVRGRGPRFRDGRGPRFLTGAIPSHSVAFPVVIGTVFVADPPTAQVKLPPQRSDPSHEVLR